MDSDQRSDVVIVGAGVTGAMLAEELTDNGLSVILIDKRGPIRGSTAATTALMQYDLDVPLTLLAKKIGAEDATRAWRRSKLGLESVASKIRSLGIECDMERVPSLYLAGNVLDREAILKECEFRNNVGLPVTYLTRGILKERYGIGRNAALIGHENLQVDPIKMVAGFLRSSLSKGARIFSPAEVVAVEHHGRDVQLLTDRGPVIRAKHVVFATGYEVLKYVKMRQHRIISTYAIATRSQKNKLWPQNAMIWEASDPYLYIRSTADGRVICGGEDEEIADADERDALLSKKIAVLERKLKKLLPQLDAKAEFAWAGSFGSSTTGLPAIGTVKGMPHCYAIMAFGGNGMIFSRIASEIIANAIKGREDPEADLFALPE